MSADETGALTRGVSSEEGQRGTRLEREGPLLWGHRLSVAVPQPICEPIIWGSKSPYFLVFGFLQPAILSLM